MRKGCQQRRRANTLRPTSVSNQRHAGVRPENTGAQIVDALERRLPQWNP
jgi:hypothetical protein